MKGGPGLAGQNGFDGPRGPRGPEGPSGQEGRKGLKGNAGRDGYPGLVGLPGAKGAFGSPGRTGSPGPLGKPGFPGKEGRDAPMAPAPKSRGYFFVMHSQSGETPECPKGTYDMWEGYSLLHVYGNDQAVGQDLGQPGSCLRRFTTMPYLFCNNKQICNYANANHYSYWLSTLEPMPMDMSPIVGQNIEKYISKCVVCEAPTKAIAIHSQAMDIPNCPPNWLELWTGYSFLMHTDAGAEGAGQSLVSTGSCLKDFRARPFIECHGHGRCNYYTSAYSYWLATIAENEQFSRPVPQTLKGPANTRSKISRCVVCLRKPPDRIIPFVL